MLVIINNGGKLSQKALFVIGILKLVQEKELLFVFQKDNRKFNETWNANCVELANTTKGILVHYLLMFVKSPSELHDGILRRVLKKTCERKLVSEGFLSNLSLTLEQYFATSLKTKRLIKVLQGLCSPKTFLIDEFTSINLVNLKVIKKMGKIIYISQDVACDRLGFNNSLITKSLVSKLERDAIAQADIVVACSERDMLKYNEMNAKRSIFYPNIYPISKFIPLEKDSDPSICIVLKNHWGSTANKSLEEILNALASLKMNVKVCMIGKLSSKIPKNVNLQYFSEIPSKIEFLETISRCWISINVGVHLGGTNERKYDYSMAGLIVVNDHLGARGDFLPFEYTYVDYQDLAGKLDQLFKLGRNQLQKMGEENRRRALQMAEEQEKKIETLLFSEFKS